MHGGPPEDAILLRCLSSIGAKQNKLNVYVKNTTVSDGEPYIVAMNTHKASFAHHDFQHIPNHIPMIVKALFGYGDCDYRLGYPKDYLSQPVISYECNYRYRPHVNGTTVPSDIFYQEEYSGVSALIVSKQGFWTWQNGIPTSLTEDFLLVHNPLARNHIPKKWLKSGHEIWIERGQLHKKFWNGGMEQAYETIPLPFNLPDEIRKKLDC